MTKSEQIELQQLRETIKLLTQTLKEFTTATTEKIQTIESTVKQQPISLEIAMLNSIQQTMVESIKSVLVGYKSPITPLIEQVIERNKAKIVENIELAINDAMTLSQVDFQNQIKHKILKSTVDNAISQSGGLVDKTFNELKQNPAFRGKLTIMIDSLLTEFK